MFKQDRKIAIPLTIAAAALTALALSRRRTPLGSVQFGETYSAPVVSVELRGGQTVYTARTSRPVPAMHGFVQLIGADGRGLMIDPEPKVFPASESGMTYSWAVTSGAGDRSEASGRLSGSAAMPGQR